MMNIEFKREIKLHVKKWTMKHAFIASIFFVIVFLFSFLLNVFVQPSIQMIETAISSNIKAMIYSQNNPRIKQQTLYRFIGLSSILDQDNNQESVVVYMMLQEGPDVFFCNGCELNAGQVILSNALKHRLTIKDNRLQLNDFAFEEEISLSVLQYSPIFFEIGRENRPFIILPYKEQLLTSTSGEFVSFYTNIDDFQEIIDSEELNKVEPYVVSDIVLSNVFRLLFFIFLNSILVIMLSPIGLKWFYSKISKEITIYSNDGMEFSMIQKVLGVDYICLEILLVTITCLFILGALLFHQTLYLLLLTPLLTSLIILLNYYRLEKSWNLKSS